MAISISRLSPISRSRRLGLRPHLFWWLGIAALTGIACKSHSPARDAASDLPDDAAGDAELLAVDGRPFPPNPCLCPSGGVRIQYASYFTAPVLSIVGDTCSTTDDPVDKLILVYEPVATTCHLIVTLEDGSTWSATAEFQRPEGCCSAHLIGAGSTPFVVQDGGVDRSDSGVKDAPPEAD